MTYINIRELNRKLINANALDYIKEMIEKGSNLHKKDKTQLLTVTKYNNYDAVKYLIENGANKFIKDALVSAASSGYLNIVELLIEHGGSIKTAKRNGNESVKKWIESMELKNKLDNYLINKTDQMHKLKI